MSYRLGVDVDGTFTDLLLINEETEATFRVKVPTTPADQAAAVLDGIERVCASVGIKPSALTELRHDGNNQCRAGGKRRSRQAGHDRRLSPDSSDGALIRSGRSCGWIVWPKPEPLAALDDTVEVRERIGARGEVVRELGERARARRLGSSSGARSRPLPYR
jgi:N-methylhydantoinase A